MSLIRLWLSIIELIDRPPFSPINPPITPPMKAPKKGTGISTYPIIIPVTVVPTAPTAITDACPTCFIFLIELVI